MAQIAGNIVRQLGRDEAAHPATAQLPLERVGMLTAAGLAIIAAVPTLLRTFASGDAKEAKHAG